MDPFSLLPSAAAGLGLSPTLTAGVFGISAVSIALTIINLMRGEPVLAVKCGIGGASFITVIWTFGQIGGALGVT
jgi:hypothetical protein